MSETFEGMSLLKVCREQNHGHIFRLSPVSVLIACSIQKLQGIKKPVSLFIFLYTVASQTGNGHTEGGDGKGGRSTRTVHTGPTNYIQWTSLIGHEFWLLWQQHVCTH